MEKCVTALEAKLNETHDAQKRSIDESEIFEKRTMDAATELAESVRRFKKVEESSKLATERRADMELQLACLAKAVEDSLGRLSDSSRRVELLKENAPDLNLQLSKIVRACDSEVAASSNLQKTVKASEAGVRMSGGELDSPKRCE